MSEEEEEVVELWEELRDHADYEINRSYPHQIRKKSNQRILKESLCNSYLQVRLNEKKYYKHRLIALQWLPNPNNLPYIDHLNHVRNDNRLSNLMWVTHEENANNLGTTNHGRKINYVDLPEDVIPVDHYNQHRFMGYYFSLTEDKFYKALTNGKNREIETYLQNGLRVVGLTNLEKNRVIVYHDKFLRMYDLV